jgi:H+/Cl- antiporter ClcA
LCLLTFLITFFLLKGAFGGGLATWFAEKVEFKDENDKKLVVLSGMSGALGGLFPTPLLATLMLHELGDPPK